MAYRSERGTAEHVIFPPHASCHLERAQRVRDPINPSHRKAKRDSLLTLEMTKGGMKGRAGCMLCYVVNPYEVPYFCPYVLRLYKLLLMAFNSKEKGAYRTPRL